MITVLTIIASRHADSYLSPFYHNKREKDCFGQSLTPSVKSLSFTHSIKFDVQCVLHQCDNCPIKMLHHIKERARKMWQESSSLLQIKSLEYNLSCCVERNLFLSQNFVTRLFCTFAACLMAGSVVTLTNKNYYFLIICSTFKIHFC